MRIGYAADYDRQSIATFDGKGCAECCLQESLCNWRLRSASLKLEELFATNGAAHDSFDAYAIRRCLIACAVVDEYRSAPVRIDHDRIANNCVLRIRGSRADQGSRHSRSSSKTSRC